MPPHTFDQLNIFRDPTFSATLRGNGMPEVRRTRLSFPELLCHVDTDALLSLDRMQAHQRMAVVTAIAILHHLGRRQLGAATGTPVPAEQYWEALETVLGANAGRLVAP